MKVKKEWIALFVSLLIVVNIINIVAILTVTELKVDSLVTGKATGQASICIVRPPSISTIADQSATVSQAFTYQVQTKFYGNNSSTTFFDNTSLFDINQSGYISFTPSSGQAGSHTIQIIAQDLSACLGINSTTSFLLTIVSANESTPSTTPSTGAGAGGGGGGGAPPEREPAKISSFDVSKKKIQTTVKTSKESRQAITITNDGETDLEFSVEDYPSIVDISPTSFTLAPGAIQELTIIINPQHAQPNIYTGQISITAGRMTETIDVIIQVESEVVLFDGKVEILGDVNQIFPGSTLKAEISIGGLIPGEVTLEYLLLDSFGNSYSLGTEILGVDGEATIVREFTVPKDLESGDYVFAVKMISGESFATTTQNIKIPSSSIAGQAFATGRTAITKIALPLMFLAILTIAVIVLSLHIRTKRHGEIIRAAPRISRIKPITKTIVKTKIVSVKPSPSKDVSGLKHKLSLIQEGYREGAINEDTYRKSKEKIEKMLGR